MSTSSSTTTTAAQPLTLVYGVPFGCSFGSIVALEWSNLPYQLIRHQFQATEKHATFQHISPSGQTPALVTESGTPLVESMAILAKIGSTNLESGLYAKQGTEAFDQLNALLAYLHTSGHGAWALGFRSKFHPSDNAQVDAAFTEDAKTKVNKLLARLDKTLRLTPFLAGNSKTVADAYFTGFIRWNNIFHFADLQKEYPNVYRLQELLEKDPAVIFAHNIEDQKEAKTTGKFLGHVTYDQITVQ